MIENFLLSLRFGEVKSEMIHWFQRRLSSVTQIYINQWFSSVLNLKLAAQFADEIRFITWTNNYSRTLFLCSRWFKLWSVVNKLKRYLTLNYTSWEIFRKLTISHVSALPAHLHIKQKFSGKNVSRLKVWKTFFESILFFI